MAQHFSPAIVTIIVSTCIWEGRARPVCSLRFISYDPEGLLVTDEHKIRDAADAVKGALEAVPVYQDVVQPAAQEIGLTLHGVVHVAIAPLRAIIWGFDRIEEFLVAALEKRLQNVGHDQIITPNLMVAGPAVESLRFAGHDPTLRELYAHLLATAMDASTARDAHPAFVEILRQLTPDEARILQGMAKAEGGEAFPLVSVHARHPDLMKGYSIALRNFSLLGEQCDCSYPELITHYLDNLARLGVIEITDEQLIDTSGYAPLKQHAKIQEAVEQVKRSETDYNVADVVQGIIRVTTLGSQFIRACVADRREKN